MDIGAKLKLVRAASGLRQTDLAVLCGLDHSIISRIENGRLNPTEAEISALKKALGWDDQLDRTVETLAQTQAC